MKKVFICLLVVVLANVVAAQKDVRYTYLWDVTLSMKGYNGAPDIYNKVVEVMVKDINSITDERAEIVVVPFQDKAYEEVWREKATPAGKKNIISKIKNYENKKVTNTNISAPLQYALDNIFSADRIDIMKLMTDGNDNVNPTGLRQLLDHWCQLAKDKDVYGYYILLTNAAKDDNLTMKLKEICRMEVVDANGQLEGINNIVQETPRFAEGIFINIRNEYNQPKVLEFVQYMGNGVPTGFKIHFHTRPNSYVKVDEVAEMRADNTVVIHPKFLVSQEELMANLSTTSYDSTIVLDFEPVKAMSTGKFAFTRLIGDHCNIFLVNKPEKTVRIYFKE